jgi:peptide/nickel transport system substrate-binding protein
MELYDQIKGEPDEEARNELFREILTIAKEEFWVIGAVRVTEGYGIVSNELHNVGDDLPESARFNTPAPANPEQWFFE